MDDMTQRLSDHLNQVMTSRHLKLEYVAAASGVAVETVRRVKNRNVTRLRDGTAHKLAVFLEAETRGGIAVADLLGMSNGRSEDFYRLLIEKNRDGIYVIQDGRIVFCNARVTEMTGYSAEELQSMDYTQFLDLDSQKFEMERTEKQRQGEKVPDRFAVKVVCKDGRILQAETHVTRFVYEGSSGALGTLREVEIAN